MARQVSALKQVTLAACLLGAAALAWQNRERIEPLLGLAAPEAPSGIDRSTGVPVIVAAVDSADDDLVLEAVGTGRAQKSITLRSETEGKVVEMPMEPGRRYAQDDVLVRLDDSGQRLAVALAETRLAEAERVLSRFRRLEDAGTAAVARLDEARTAAEIARIELETAREALEDRILRAPFDGVAGLSDTEVGDWVDSGVDIASYDDRSVLLVGFDLPEALLARITPGMSVSATTPAVPGLRFEGSVAAIDSRIEAASRTARVRIAIPNPQDTLRPGASFTVRLELPGETYPIVPELALQFAQGSLHVWRIEDGADRTAAGAGRVEVRLIRRRAGKVLVEGPLGPGDLVVIEGTQRLAPGKPVTIVKTANGGST